MEKELITNIPKLEDFIGKKEDSLFLFGFIERYFILDNFELMYKININTDRITEKFLITNNTNIVAVDLKIYIQFDDGNKLELKFINLEQLQLWEKGIKQTINIFEYINLHKINGILGNGNNGNIFKVQNMDKIYAFKKIKSNSNVKNELSILKLLNDKHKNIVKVVNIFTNSKQTIYFFQYENCIDLYNYIINGCKNDKTITKQIAEGLKFLHSYNIVHLDIKLENILLTHKGEVKIIDFELSKYIENDLCYPTTNDILDRTFDFIYKDIKLTFLGTIGYIPPEILLFNCISPYADIWCFGIIIYIFECNIHPFYSTSIKETIENSLQCNLNLNINASKFIIQILNICPNKRITIDEIINNDYFLNI